MESAIRRDTFERVRSRINYFSMRRIDLTRNIISGMILALLLIGMLTSASNFRQFEASCYQPVFTGPVYIRSDGSVDPSTAPIRLVQIIIDIHTGVSTYAYALTGSTSSNTSGIVIERDNVIVDGAGYTVQGAGNGNGTDLSGRSNVTIKNTTIRGFDTGIQLSSSSKNIVSGNNVTNNDGYGIHLDSSSNCTNIDGNNVTENVYGIGIYSSSGNVVSENDVASNWYGIYLESSSNNTISANNLTSNIHGDGIYLGFSSNSNVVCGNRIANSNNGIWIYSSSSNFVYGNGVVNNSYDGIGLDSCYGISVTGNNITSNNARGIYLLSSSLISISRNSLTSNNYGIIVWSSSNISISENNVTRNNCGIYLQSSSGSAIYHNNINNNMSQALTDSAGNVWDNGYPSGGNYWSDYAGSDLFGGPYQNMMCSDGIGDFPYGIFSNGTDRYPLMKPYPSHDAAIASIMAFPATVCQGCGCEIEVYVSNKGDFAETYNVQINANMTRTTGLAYIHTFKNVTLTKRGSCILVFTWDTTHFELGDYRISVVAFPSWAAGVIIFDDSTLEHCAVQIVSGMNGAGGGRMPYMN